MILSRCAYALGLLDMCVIDYNIFGFIIVIF